MPRLDHFQDITVAGNLSLSATSKITPAFTPDRIGGIRIVGGQGTLPTIQDTIDDLPASGGTVFIPAGAYTSTVAITLSGDDICVVGAGREATVVEFTGATDGFVVSGTNRETICLENLTIRTTNASGGKAISITDGNETVLRNLLIGSSGSGRWAYGLWGDDWQVSYVYALKIEQSATIGVRLQNFSNAVSFFGTEIVGTSGAGTINRAIEFDTVTDSFWFGGTLQGNFEQSLINSQTSSPHFYGFHLENTDASPSDGADVIVTAGVNASFDGMQGGDFDFGTAAGSLRNCSLANSEVGVLTLGANAEGCTVMNTRATSITDNGARNVLLGNSKGDGNQFGDKLGRILAANNTATLPDNVFSGGSAFGIANAATIIALDSGGTARTVWIPLSAADQTFLQYKATEALIFRNTSNATKLTLADSKLTIASGVELEVNGDLNHDGTNVGFYGTSPTSQASAAADLTGNAAGSTDGIIQPLTDPASALLSVDALRNDLVANIIPELRNNIDELRVKVNSALTTLRGVGLIAT